MGNNLKGYTSDNSITYERVFGNRNTKVSEEVVFFDENDNVVDQTHGNIQKAVITEKDELGQMISETFGSFETVSDNDKKKSK